MDSADTVAVTPFDSATLGVHVLVVNEKGLAGNMLEGAAASWTVRLTKWLRVYLRAQMVRPRVASAADVISLLFPIIQICPRSSFHGPHWTGCWQCGLRSNMPIGLIYCMICIWFTCSLTTFCLAHKLACEPAFRLACLLVASFCHECPIESQCSLTCTSHGFKVLHRPKHCYMRGNVRFLRVLLSKLTIQLLGISNGRQPGYSADAE
mmetsp:Transcript_3214/g.7229  ORF Transcript_3214/g.7229 Transcript_3214/m.7229 type:complete len:208 (-) Transcript_3214:455-1078(-)